MNSVPLEKNHLKDVLVAILFCVAGWLSFSVCDTITKWLAQSYGVSQVIFLSTAPVAVFSALMILIKQGKNGFNTIDLKWHLIRSVAVVMTALCVINALKTVPLADYYGITFLAPFISAILAMIFLKEHLGRHRLIAIICGFIGVLVIAQPQFATYSIGILFAFGATLSISATAIILRKMKSKGNLFLFSFFPSLANSLVHAPSTFRDFITPTWLDSLLFAALALSVMLGLLILATGLRKAPAYAVVAPFQYTQIAWGIMFGYFIFGDLPTPTTIAGIAIIVLSGMYLIWREYQVHGTGSKKRRRLRIFSKSQRF